MVLPIQLEISRFKTQRFVQLEGCLIRPKLLPWVEVVIEDLPVSFCFECKFLTPMSERVDVVSPKWRQDADF